MPRFIASIMLIASVAACGPVDQPAGDSLPRPTTVDEAAQRLRDRLSPRDLEWIRRNPKDVVTSELHLPFGTGVRNEFGLWGSNQALLKSCGTDQAEKCSGIIFAALWDKIRAETDPTLSHRLDCQFSAANRISIDTTGWYKLQLGELLDNLQQQIDQHKSAYSPGCNESMKIVVFGNPDLKCFVRVEFEYKDNLTRMFQWVAWRNSFTVRHDPPNVELTFNKKCAFPERIASEYFVPKGRK